MIAVAIACAIITATKCITLKGDIIKYRLVAKDRDSTRSKIYTTGLRFSGITSNGQTLLYHGIYPQFMVKKDTVAADTLYYDFWDGIMSVSAWY